MATEAASRAEVSIDASVNASPMQSPVLGEERIVPILRLWCFDLPMTASKAFEVSGSKGSAGS